MPVIFRWNRRFAKTPKVICRLETTIRVFPNVIMPVIITQNHSIMSSLKSTDEQPTHRELPRPKRILLSAKDLSLFLGDDLSQATLKQRYTRMRRQAKKMSGQKLNIYDLADQLALPLRRVIELLNNFG